MAADVAAAGVVFALVVHGGAAAALAFERGNGGARGYHARGIGQRTRRGIFDVASGGAGALHGVDAGTHHVLDAAGADCAVACGRADVRACDARRRAHVGGALYHQSTIDKLFTDALSLTLGIRYDWEQAHTDYKAYRSINDTTGITDSFKSKLTFRQLTPKATLQYSFSGNQLLYATVSKGYKSGGFNTSFERDEDRSFEPEYSWNYEAGTKLNFWQNRIKTELSLFYIDWRNQQIYQPLPSGKGSMLKNAGRSESKGIEFALQANVCNGFMFNVAYGYTDATFKEYQRSATLDYAGKKLPLVPSQTFSVGTDYLFRVKSPLLDRIQMNISYSGTGKLYWSESNEAFQKYYGIWNGKVSFMKGALTASIWGKNLTGTEYTAFYFESGGNSFAQKGKPVTFGGNLTLNF